MYLGIDLGTSGVKVLLIDADQRVVATSSAEIDVSRPHAGWSEQDPADWIAAVENAIGEMHVQNGALLAATKGIGLSGHMHGATLVDAADRVIRPCILWNDTRSHREAAELDADPRFRAISGNIVFPGFTAPKLMWVARNEPENFSSIGRVLLPKDYLRLWLTGEAISDMSDSAGTSWLDVGRRAWSDTLIEATGLERRHMPSLIEGTGQGGQLRPALARRWGMGSGVIVAGGGGDNAASAVGIGATREGEAFVSLGTSGVIFAANDGFRPLPQSAVHAFCHALPGRWHQMGVILSATDSLNWLAAITGTEPAVLTGELGEALDAPGREYFLPYLSGERTPHNDAAIRGALVGLGHISDRKALTRAVLRGVAFALKDNLEALADAGTQIDRLIAVGGGSRSTLWLSMIATTLGVPIDVPADGDFGAAFGAARLGLIAAEGADADSICTLPVIARTIEPDVPLRDAYLAAHARFRALYPALRNSLHHGE